MGIGDDGGCHGDGAVFQASALVDIAVGEVVQDFADEGVSHAVACAFAVIFARGSYTDHIMRIAQGGEEVIAAQVDIGIDFDDAGLLVLLGEQAHGIEHSQVAGQSQQVAVAGKIGYDAAGSGGDLGATAFFRGEDVVYPGLRGGSDEGRMVQRQ